MSSSNQQPPKVNSGPNFNTSANPFTSTDPFQTTTQSNTQHQFSPQGQPNVQPQFSPQGQPNTQHQFVPQPQPNTQHQFSPQPQPNVQPQFAPQGQSNTRRFQNNSTMNMRGFDSEIIEDEEYEEETEEDRERRLRNERVLVQIQSNMRLNQQNKRVEVVSKQPIVHQVTGIDQYIQMEPIYNSSSTTDIIILNPMENLHQFIKTLCTNWEEMDDKEYAGFSNMCNNFLEKYQNHQMIFCDPESNNFYFVFPQFIVDILLNKKFSRKINSNSLNYIFSCKDEISKVKKAINNVLAHIGNKVPYLKQGELRCVYALHCFAEIHGNFLGNANLLDQFLVDGCAYSLGYFHRIERVSILIKKMLETQAMIEKNTDLNRKLFISASAFNQ
jgi:hypothetical protein